MTAKPSTKPWAIFSGVLFLIAVLIGAGPGIHLINPAESAAAEEFFIFGMPKLYAWAILWFVVQATALSIAYVKVWKD
ncbi:MAG: hypothetical protein ACI8UO_002299 [Verrucomicrobiales bacterium]|jgi:hypothetical protein